jgi:L-cysteine desulfidase
MDKQSRTYQAYVQILKEELIPAMGCTEPIAIAYAAAKARDVLGGMPDKVEIGVSSNIIKNVKSVIVPNTDGMKGIEAAAAAGIVGGQADKALEVISAVTADQKAAMRAFLKQVPVTVKAIDNGFIFDIIVTLRQGERFRRGAHLPVSHEYCPDPKKQRSAAGSYRAGDKAALR